MNKDHRLREIVAQLFNPSKRKYIFIYTPPKVGSTSLVTSLRLSLNPGYNILHIHDDIMLSVLGNISDVTVNELIDYVARHNDVVFVIDVYRSPIERKMSEYFEKLSPYHFNNSEDSINKYNIDRIINRFNKVFRYLGTGDHYIDKYGIKDIPVFDPVKGYTLQKIGNVQYVKLRLLDSDRWSSILSEIMCRDVVVVRDYETSKKSLSDLYKLFKDNYKLPINYYREIEGCKYMNFYYTASERESYLNKYRSNLSPETTGYSQSEYDLYMRICIENQYYIDRQINHYLDNGCDCNGCTSKRRDNYKKVKNGEPMDCIIHVEKVLHKVIRRIKKRSVKMDEKMSKKFNLMG